jgi:hypothetical protein
VNIAKLTLFAPRLQLEVEVGNPQLELSLSATRTIGTVGEDAEQRLKKPDQFLRNVAPSDEHRSKKTKDNGSVVALIIKKMMGVKEERRWLGNTTSGDGYPLFIIFGL